MEREALGIRQVIDEGLQKPEQTAKIIARMLVRDIWAQVHKHSTRNHWELSPLEQVALVALKLEGKCKQIARQQVQKSFIPSIKLILEEHISGNINVAVSAELQKMIAQAVLELIAV